MKYFNNVPKIEFEINLNSDLIRRIFDFIKILSKIKEEINNIDNILKSIRDIVNIIELR
jgi:hypothetical protein